MLDVVLRDVRVYHAQLSDLREVLDKVVQCVARLRARSSPFVNGDAAFVQVEQRAQRRLGIQDIALTDADLERIEAQIDSDRSPLEDLLAELPDDQRDAIRAHVLDEDTYDEISRRLGTSQAVVRKRVSRGLHQLRRQIEGD